MRDVLSYGLIYSYLHLKASIAFQKGMDTIVTQMLPLPEKRIRVVLGTFEPSDVAVVIPLLCSTFEQLQDFAMTVDSVKEYPLNIVVCIDGPTPYLNDILSMLPNVTFLISAKQRGTAFAINRCLEHIQEFMQHIDRICMLDVGVVIDSHWWNTVSGFKELDYIVSGITKSVFRPESGWICKQLQYFYNHYGLLTPRINKETREILYGHGCNLVVPKTAFNIRFLEDYFPESGYEDIEYCIRAQRIHGFKIALCKELKAVHVFREKSLGDMEKRFRQYGRSYKTLSQLISEFDSEYKNSVPVK